MKRLWIAAAILVLVFSAALCHSFYISSFTDRLIDLLEEAESGAESSDWDRAQTLTDEALQRWEDRDSYLHVTLRHDETDVVYTGFREVLEFIQCREGGEYSAANARLIANLELLAEAEQLTLKNVM